MSAYDDLTEAIEIVERLQTEQMSESERLELQRKVMSLTLRARNGDIEEQFGPTINNITSVMMNWTRQRAV